MQRNNVVIIASLIIFSFAMCIFCNSITAAIFSNSSTKNYNSNVTPSVVTKEDNVKSSPTITFISTITSTPTFIPTPTPSPSPSPTPLPTSTPIPTKPPITNSPIIINQNTPEYVCNCSKTCPNMTCNEAYYQLNVCGCHARDGNNDGIPCNAQCE